MDRGLKLGGRSLRQWGLLAVSIVIVALSVGEALGAHGPLRHALLWKAGGGAPAGAGQAELAGDPDSSSIFGSRRGKRARLVTNVGGRALFQLPKLIPGRVTARCVTVAYRGPRRARVHLFATRRTTALDPYVTLTVTRGRGRPTRTGACGKFRPDARNYVGAGKGVLFRGKLSTFPRTLKVAARRRGPAAWRKRESHTYRFQVAIAPTNAARGRSSRFNLVWQVRP